MFDLDRLSNAALGRLGGALFMAASLVVAASAPFLGLDDLAGLEWVALASLVVGGLFLALPWSRWRRSTLVVQSVVALGLIALADHMAPGAQGDYLALYTVIFLFVGLTQSVQVVSWMVPAAVAAFVLGASGGIEPHAQVRFGVTLAVGYLIGLVLAATGGLTRATNARMEDLLEVSQALIRSRRMTDTALLLESSTNRLVGADAVFTFITDSSTSTRYVTLLPTPRGIPDPLVIEVCEEPGKIARALDRGEAVFIHDVTGDDRISSSMTELLGCTSVLFLPILGEHARLGSVVFCWRTLADRPVEWALRAIMLLATEASIVLERQRGVERVEVEAATDPLTGLFNRRSIDARLRSLAPGDAVLLFDLDRFKEVNDTLGHAAGDEVLCTLAACLLAACRQDDWCARLGGDEFLVVLRQGGHGGTKGVLADLHQAWRAGEAGTSFSAGAAVAHTGEEPWQVMARADDALYRAKQSGRDRVEISIGHGT